MAVQSILVDGKPYVILPRSEYDQLATLAKAADLPPLPEANEDGHYPAVEYARASLARKIIRDRVAAGLSQRQLAECAGIRVETLCRIETGKHTPSVPTIDKIDRALKQAASLGKARARKPRSARNTK
ncbi:MAG TPA: helix-turn-helix transcriptional regulator [Planctomycetaceae bacterium]|nr:helix-turn-helix transcriptional regulator [Planctomycetaceae bacterium]